MRMYHTAAMATQTAMENIGNTLHKPVWPGSGNDAASVRHPHFAADQKTLTDLDQGITNFSAQNPMPQISGTPTAANIASMQQRKHDLQALVANVQSTGQKVVAGAHARGAAYQRHADSNRPGLDDYAKTLTEQSEKAQRIAQEIRDMEGVASTEKLQLKSYWLQSTILLVVLMIFIYRVVASAYSDSTGVFDLVLAVVAIAFLVYEHWNQIWDPIVNGWRYVYAHYINTEI